MESNSEKMKIRSTIIKLKRLNYSKRQISAILNVDGRLVNRWYNRDSLNDLQRSGRPTNNTACQGDNLSLNERLNYYWYSNLCQTMSENRISI